MKRLRSSSGQMTIEAVLLITLMAGLFRMVQNSIKGQEFLSKLVSGPWSHVQGMTQNGVWEPADTGNTVHPNVFGRRASPEPF